MSAKLEFVVLICAPELEICRMELWSDGDGNTRVETFIQPMEARSEMGALLLVAAKPQVHPYFQAKILSMLAMMQSDMEKGNDAALN